MSAVPFTVKAVFEYTSEHEDDLNFSIGQIITVTEEEDADWYYGNYTNHAGAKQEGIFPRNFVEKYEPPAPPRPTRPARTRKESETASQSPPLASESAVPDIPQEDSQKRSIDLGSTVEAEKKAAPSSVPYEASKTSAPIPAPSSPPMSPPSQKAAPPPPSAPVEAPAKKAPPPAVAEKPTAGSFRDRIAAFNKASAAPITPFNHATHTSSSFVKKPFVAPPPSKNAYVPPPIEHPQTYRREEPQETSLPIRSEALEGTEATEEEEPKPTSLKERIALLQKQQLEQASRHAEAAQKKEKPKKPAKKKVESQELVEPSESVMGVELQRTETSETAKESSAASGDPAEEGTQPKHRTPVLPPARELTSDTNDADNSAAGDTEEASETSTSKEDVEEKSPESRALRPTHGDAPGANGSEEEESEEQEEDEIDPEIRRRMEIRDRMAKISGGMGMMGMFGAPAGLPGMPTGSYKKPKAPSADAGTTEQQPEAYAPPVQLMALPGMHVRKPEEKPKSPSAVPEALTEASMPPPQPLPLDSEDAPETTSEEPITPHGRPVPPLPPVAQNLPPPPPPPETRPVPPPPPPHRILTSPSLGAKSNDEVVLSPARTEKGDDESYFAGHEASGSTRQSMDQASISSPVSSPVSGPGKRQNPPPPPLPSAPPVPPSAQTRPPPPPPPVTEPSPDNTGDSRMSSQTPTHPLGNESEEEITEYEGDYDTDIASGAKHKDALKTHVRDSSIDEGTLADSFSPHSPRSPVETRPPIPQNTFQSTAPRSAPPPPPPSQPPKAVRQSVDMPRAPPPPIPQTMYTQEDETHERSREEAFDQYTSPAVPAHRDRGESQIKDIPDPASYELPQHAVSSQAPRPSRGSSDLLRGQTGTRRSMDVSRPSMDQGYMANDVDLASTSLWWTQPNTPPPVFQGRRDILIEMEESSTNKRGGKVTTSKDVYILFMDYSQTIISAQFDSKNPIDVALEQRHEPPPPRLRQDQLEDAHTQFGARISESVASKQNTTVGDGTPHALIQTLLAPLKDALLPVGVRSYGALVYANLANASVQQFDEIRPGDIITFRNCRFQGHRGTMHQKYSTEVGKPDHAGIVSDWDGTKKKVRVWEQGRESKKTKVESYKLGDLKSGECRVWRVMSRTWVGWDGEHKA